MSDPNDLAAFLDLGWERLGLGLTDRRAAARELVLASISTEGKPEARTVVLRAADRAAATAEVHTDLGSTKVRSLTANPLAQLHIWDAPVQLQIRLSTRVSIHHGASVAHKWDCVPDGSRMSYGASPAPGTPIDHAHDYVKQPAQDMFAVLTCAIEEIELMQLSKIHRRAVFKASSGWAGQWVVP